MTKRHPSLIPLSEDHHHGLALALRCRKQSLGQIKPTGGEGLRARAEEFLHFYDTELSCHFRAEEEILFPLMREHVPASVTLIEALSRDHNDVRQALPDLKAGRALAKLIFDLGDLLERHIRKEERELFPLFEIHADQLDAENVGADIRRLVRVRVIG
jgi:iron-sulfur cluster repair protein YtfE (RIC family)